MNKIDKNLNYKEMFASRLYKNIEPKEFIRFRMIFISVSLFLGPFVTIGLYRSEIFDGSQIEKMILSLFIGISPFLIYIFGFKYIAKKHILELEKIGEKEFPNQLSAKEKKFLQKNFEKIISLDNKMLKKIYEDPFKYKDKIKERESKKIKSLLKKFKTYDGKYEYTQKTQDKSIMIIVFFIMTTFILSINILDGFLKDNINKDLLYIFPLLIIIFIFISKYFYKKDEKEMLEHTKTPYNELYNKKKLITS